MAGWEIALGVIAIGVAIVSATIAAMNYRLAVMNYRMTHLKKTSSPVGSFETTDSGVSINPDAEILVQSHTVNLWYPTIVVVTGMSFPVGLYLFVDAVWNLNDVLSDVLALLSLFIVIFAPVAAWKTVRDKGVPDGQRVPLISYFVALVVYVPTAYLWLSLLAPRFVPTITVK